jgi:hypothetical protein
MHHLILMVLSVRNMENNTPWSDSLPDSFEWPNRGIAHRLMPKGMSDYQRGNGNAVYETSCGARLFLTHQGYRAQLKNVTTGLKTTGEQAVQALEDRLNVEP